MQRAVILNVYSMQALAQSRADRVYVSCLCGY